MKRAPEHLEFLAELAGLLADALVADARARQPDDHVMVKSSSRPEPQSPAGPATQPKGAA